MNNLIINPNKLAQTLGVFEYISPPHKPIKNDCEWEDTTQIISYTFILSPQNKKTTQINEDEVAMSLYFTSEKNDFLSISVTIPKNSGDLLIAFRNITNVVYLPKRKTVIFESFVNEYYSVLELENVNKKIKTTLNSNLSENDYINNFKNY